MSAGNRKTTVGDSINPSGEVDYRSVLPANAPQAFLDEEEEWAERTVYESSIQHAREWVRKPAPTNRAGQFKSTSRDAEYYHRQLTVLINEFDLARVDVEGGLTGIALRIGLERLGRKGAAVGALFNEAAMTGAIKIDRDKQISNRKSRSASATKVNRQRKPSNQEAGIEALQDAARRLSGWQAMSKKRIISALKNRGLIPSGLSLMSSRRLAEVLGPEFGQRGNARKSKR